MAKNVVNGVQAGAAKVKEAGLDAVEALAERIARGAAKGFAGQLSDMAGVNSPKEAAIAMKEGLKDIAAAAGAEAGAHAGKNTGREFTKAGLSEIYHAANKLKVTARNTFSKMKRFIKLASGVPPCRLSDCAPRSSRQQQLT